MIGSPLGNACSVVRKYEEGRSRSYYSSAIVRKRSIISRRIGMWSKHVICEICNPNLAELVLGCTEADCCNQIFVGKLKLFVAKICENFLKFPKPKKYSSFNSFSQFIPYESYREGAYGQGGGPWVPRLGDHDPYDRTARCAVGLHSSSQTWLSALKVRSELRKWIEY